MSVSRAERCGFLFPFSFRFVQRSFPDVRIEGGEYTPPVSVQYAIRAIRASQLAVAAGYFFGAQAAASLRRAPPALVEQMSDNPMMAIGSVFGLDVVAQTLHSINAFEITYNGQKLHSKLSTGRLPRPDELIARLAQVRKSEALATGSARLAA
mmetsp:Transcript_2163/g.7065  ORF Transcript_2163/g.7065 Transcript_2163/m.7065 type:complete len:153 (-) Transcript_2163:2200-2658(-)